MTGEEATHQQKELTVPFTDLVVTLIARWLLA
jgi:hypothetical protein